MKIFITGATGFIGSHLVNKLSLDGHSIKAIRRSSTNKPRFAIDYDVEWIDKRLGEVTSSDLQGCEVLVHLAAAGVSPQPADWENCFEVNVVQSQLLVEKAISVGIQKVIATGTYTEYGLSGLRYEKIPPNAPLEPTDAYAASKACASIVLTSMCRAMKFNLGYYRLFSIFGEGQYEMGFWPQLRKAAMEGEDFKMTSGEQIRDFMTVQEATNYLAKSINDKSFKRGTPRIENIASGKPVRLVDFATEWWERFQAKGKLLPGTIPDRPNEVLRYVPLIGDSS